MVNVRDANIRHRQTTVMAADKCLHIVYSIHHVPRTYLWQLFCNVSPHKHSFQVDPEVLDYEPIFNVSEVLESFCTHRAISFLKGALYLQPNSIVTYLTGMQACTPMLNYKSMFQLPMGINTNKA